MITDWQETAANAHLALRVTQAAALQTLRLARATGSEESYWLLSLAVGALRESTRLAVSLRPYRRWPMGIVQVDADGRRLRASVE